VQEPDCDFIFGGFSEVYGKAKFVYSEGFQCICREESNSVEVVQIFEVSRFFMRVPVGWVCKCNDDVVLSWEIRDEGYRGFQQIH